MDKTTRFAFRRLVSKLHRAGALTDADILELRIDFDTQAMVLRDKGDEVSAKELLHLSSNLDQDSQTGL